MSHSHNKLPSKLHGCVKFLMFYCASHSPYHLIPPSNNQQTCYLFIMLIGCLLYMRLFSSLGVPLPRVTWFKEHALIDDSYQELNNGSIRNVLHLPRITRSDLETVSRALTSCTMF